MCTTTKMASSTHGDEIDGNNRDSKMAKRHEEWMAEYGRVYKDEAEKAWRFEIFKKNVKYIEDFNSSGEHSYTLGVNLFADLTHEEFAATYLCRFKKPEEEFDDSLNTSCPSRTQGVYSDMKRPGTCAAIEAPPPAPPAVEEAVVIKAEALAPAAEETKTEEPAAAEQVPAEVGEEEKPSPTEEAKVVEEPVAEGPKAEEKLEAVAEETKEDVIEEIKAAEDETAALTVKEVKAEDVKEKNCGF